MKYEDFKEFKLVKDESNPFTPHFIVDEERDFYVEPVVFTQLAGFKERHPDKYDLIIKSMVERVMKNKKRFYLFFSLHNLNHGFYLQQISLVDQ